MKRTSRESVDSQAVDRRRFLGAALGACAISPLGRSLMQLAASMSGSLTKEQPDSMTGSKEDGRITAALKTKGLAL
jgi:hypothetical protein